MNKRMIIMLVVCALVFGGLFGFKWFQNMMMNQFFDQMAAQENLTVSSAQAKERNWIRSLKAVGTVRAVDGVDVTTEAPGVVETIEFDSGDQVTKGDVLVRLRDDVAQAQLRALKAAAAEAQSGYDRAQKLYANNNLSESERDLQRSQLVQAQAEVKAQEERISQKVIRAPFSGKLGIRKVNKGQHIQPGTPVVNLQSLAPIHVNFSLPEQEMRRVDKGMTVEVELSGYPEETFEGAITALEPGVSQDTRNFGVQARVKNKDRKMRPGMFANVDVRMPGSDSVVVIPRTAISFNPYGDSVYVLREKDTDGQKGSDSADNEGEDKRRYTVKRRFVETGRTRGSLVAIKSGLDAGERVVSSGLLKLTNNATVLINNEVQPAEDPAPKPDNS